MFDLNVDISSSSSLVNHERSDRVVVVVDKVAETASSNVDLMGLAAAAKEDDQWLKLSVSDSRIPTCVFNSITTTKEMRSAVMLPPRPPLSLVSRNGRRGPRSRSSQYKGVTFYRRTGRWESHIWDSGRQVYLGGFDTAYIAARIYDRAAIRFRGLDADINFNVTDYEQDLNQTKNLSKEEFVRLLRRYGTRRGRSSSRYINTINGGVTTSPSNNFGLQPCRANYSMGINVGGRIYQDSRSYGLKITARHNHGGMSNDNLNLNLNLGISSSVPNNGSQAISQPSIGMKLLEESALRMMNDGHLPILTSIDAGTVQQPTARLLSNLGPYGANAE